jgi:hypothetical protein
MSPNIHSSLSRLAQALCLAAGLYFMAFAEVVPHRGDSLLISLWRRLEARGLAFWQASGLTAAALFIALFACVAIPRILIRVCYLRNLVRFLGLNL